MGNNGYAVELDEYADLRAGLNVVGSKYALVIVRALTRGPKRFTALQRELGMNNSTLQARLNELLEAGMVTRARYNERPPRVDYELTEYGEQALAIIVEVERFGRMNGPGSTCGDPLCELAQHRAVA